jgi:hypothetical protein
MFGWLVADGWCWFVLREEYCWLVLAGCWWLVCFERKVLLADKPSDLKSAQTHAVSWLMMQHRGSRLTVAHT